MLAARRPRVAAAWRRLHVVHLFDFTDAHAAWFKTQLDAANTVFAAAGIAFTVDATQSVPFRHGVCRVGTCSLGGAGTPDQRALFDALPPGLGSDTIAVFMAKGLLPNSDDGCAWHPPGRLGCVVAASDDASDPQYKLAHELGHVLGLPHDDRNSKRLMFPSAAWTKLPPELGPKDLALLAGQPAAARRAVAAPSKPAAAPPRPRLMLELAKMTPDLASVCRHGEAIVADLASIYTHGSHARVRARALSALMRLRPGGVDELVASAVQSRDLPVRLAAACQLAADGGASGAHLLELLRRDHDPAVCQAAGG